MPNRKRLLGSKVYLPTGGVNHDLDSLHMGENQAAELTNLRPFPNRVQQRSGSRRIFGNSPPLDTPILLFHRYQEPAGAQITFGFTKNAIYKSNASTDLWTHATQFSLLDDCESATNWGSSVTNSQAVTAVSTDSDEPYSGSNYILSVITWDGVTPQLVSGDVLAQFNMTSAPWDASSATHIVIRYRLRHTGTGTAFNDFNLSVQFFDTAFSSQIESDFDFTWSLGDFDNYLWREERFLMADPSLYSSVKGFRIIADGNHTEGTGVVAGDLLAVEIDYITAASLFSTDLTCWDTCDFTDTVKGRTVLAAGTVPDSPVEALSDGANRKFMYYDRINGYFRDVDTRTETRTVQIEDTGEVGDGSTSQFTFTISNTLVDKGSVTITTTSTADATLTVTDDGLGGLSGSIDAAGNNDIDYTTGVVRVKFNANVKNTIAITVAYEWYDTITMKPASVFNYGNRVLCTNIWDGSSYHPWRAKWSELANLEQYSGLGFKDIVTDDISPFVGGDYIHRNLILARHGSLVQVNLIGGTSVYAFNTVSYEGTYAGKTFKAHQNEILYLGKEDVQLFDGAVSRGTGEFRIRDLLFQELSANKIHECFAAVYSRFDEYHLFIMRTKNVDPDDATVQRFPDRAYVYRRKMDAWWTATYPDEISAMGVFNTSSGITIGDLIGTIGEQNWTFQSSILNGALEAPILARLTGDVYAADERLNSDFGYDDGTDTWVTGTAIPWTLETRDFTFADLARRDRTQRLHFESLGKTFEVSYSTNYGTTWDQVETITVDPQFSEKMYWPDSSSKHIRFRFRGTTIAQFASIRWMQAFAMIEEKD